MIRRALIATVALLALAVGSAAAQNLLNNDAYQKSLNLREQAQAAFGNGDYSQSTKLAKEAEAYAKQAIEIANEEALASYATDWLGLAKERYQYASGGKVPTLYPDVWRSVSSNYQVAQDSYAAKEYERSLAFSRSVVSALGSLTAQTTLPKYYIVRLIPNRRDSFWRIAEYPFVYGNPLEWPLLYRANKELLQDPNNPNLIQPGMKFVIPSLHGELRVGTWNPPNTPVLAEALQTKTGAVLPKYYIVRLLPGHRDCFWQIAGYPFVYNNPLKWSILYKANRDALQDPNNPNLIQPGMKLLIPSLNGEAREGTWKP